VGTVHQHAQPIMLVTIIINSIIINIIIIMLIMVTILVPFSYREPDLPLGRHR
jgi:hypothetical protein